MLIGINGFKSAGKDTVGEYLVEQYDFKKASFAALLKQSAAALFDVPVDSWEEWKNDEGMLVAILQTNPNGFRDSDEPIVEITVRQFLQRYGTESHRDVFGYDFWVEQAFNSIETGSSPGHHDIVFTDARFENELTEIHERGGFNIMILREETDAQSGGHVSEVRPDLGLIDFIVNNNSTRDELYDKIDEIMGGLGVLI